MEFRRVLFRSQAEDGIRDLYVTGVQTCALPIRLNSSHVEISYAVFCLTGVQTDRKSTRLNSSHVEISYAVFCLKKEEHRSELQSRKDVACRILLGQGSEPHALRHAVLSQRRFQSVRDCFPARGFSFFF